jgi:hypothetical protein
MKNSQVETVTYLINNNFSILILVNENVFVVEFNPLFPGNKVTLYHQSNTNVYSQKK